MYDTKRAQILLEVKWMNAQIMMALSLSLKSRQICQCCHFLLEHQKQAKPKVRIPQIIWQKKGDYSINKHVCMLCANDNLKDKKIAILCRGTVHQLRRHYGRRHAKKFKDVFPIDHACVASYLITLSNQIYKSSKKKQPNVVGHASTSHTNLSDLVNSNKERELEVEEQDDMHDISQATAETETAADAGSPEAPALQTRQMVQEGIESFVQSTKPDFKEKVLGMLENLSKKVDNLKSSKGKLKDSANQAFDVLKKAYGEETLDYLIGMYAILF